MQRFAQFKQQTLRESCVDVKQDISLSLEYSVLLRIILPNIKPVTLPPAEYFDYHLFARGNVKIIHKK
jgi:hypothetical protein